MGRNRSNGEGGLFKMKGSDNWYAQFYQDGRQIRVSTKTTVKAEALQELRRLMGDRDNGRTPESERRKLRYADLRAVLIDSYVAQGNKSLKSKADGSESIVGLGALDTFFGFKRETVDGKFTVTDKGTPVSQITTDAARRFVRRRRDEGAGNAMINRSLAALRRMLRLAKRDGKIHDVPYIEFQKEPPARKGFLEREKFDELVRLLPTHLKPLVTFLYYCGSRIGETLQIEWSQVNLDAREIQLEPEQTKTSEARILPLPSVLCDMLSEVEPKTGLVFSGTNLRKEWMTACASCGLGTKIVEGKPYPFYKGLTLHDLRRSAVRNLRNAGVPENVAMKISGHKTRSVFERYNIVSTDDVRDAMRLVETASLAAGKTAIRTSPKTVDAETRMPVRSESLVRVAAHRRRKSTQLVESK